jgi:hypothetical protein
MTSSSAEEKDSSSRNSITNAGIPNQLRMRRQQILPDDASWELMSTASVAARAARPPMR